MSTVRDVKRKPTKIAESWDLVKYGKNSERIMFSL